jgi:GxxExxY protein
MATMGQLDMGAAYAGFINGELTGQIIGSAMEVHRVWGPGLLESAYRECLVRELGTRGLAVKREVAIPVAYKGERLDCGFRADVIVEDSVILELKACERLLPIHEAQLLTYLKLCGIRVGLLINFNSTSLRLGIRRLVR